MSGRGGWHKPQPAYLRRSPATTPIAVTPTPERPRSDTGEFTMVPRKPKPPSASWWITTTSREDFDRRAADRAQEAGWVGKGTTR
jgi:hypothetical protein